MMEPDTTQAIEIIRQGNLKEGAKILSQILKTNPEDESAWLWMSACVSDQDKKIYCLEKVVQLNPSNQAARKGLAALGVDAAPEIVQPASPDASAEFSYRDLTATLGRSSPAAPVQEAEVPAGRSFADAVKQAQTQVEQPEVEVPVSQPIEQTEPLPQTHQPSASAERAMMMEDFDGPASIPETEVVTPSLQPVEPVMRAPRRRRSKNNWLLGVIILLLVLLLIFVLFARFGLHVI